MKIRALLARLLGAEDGADADKAFEHAVSFPPPEPPPPTVDQQLRVIVASIDVILRGQRECRRVLQDLQQRPSLDARTYEVGYENGNGVVHSEPFPAAANLRGANYSAAKDSLRNGKAST